MTRKIAYRSAVAVAVGTALFLLWGMGALGIVGIEGDPADRMYYGVLAIEISGAVVARFQPDGMARAMFMTAAATILVGGIALMLGKHQAEYSSARIHRWGGWGDAVDTWKVPPDVRFSGCEANRDAA